jgi:hypothetical protein
MASQDERRDLWAHLADELKTVAQIIERNSLADAQVQTRIREAARRAQQVGRKLGLRRDMPFAVHVHEPQGGAAPEGQETALEGPPDAEASRRALEEMLGADEQAEPRGWWEFKVFSPPGRELENPAGRPMEARMFILPRPGGDENRGQREEILGMLRPWIHYARRHAPPSQDRAEAPRVPASRTGSKAGQSDEATGDGKSAVASLNAPPPEGEWSKPMTKTKMMELLGIDSPKTFKAFANRIGIRRAGNRQTWQLRVDKLDARNRAKIEKA